MNIKSIIVSNKNIVGEIILEKQNNEIIIKESNSIKIIRDTKNEISEFNSITEIINKIKGIISSMCFSSRFIGLDMYTNKTYEDNDPNFYTKYIYGIESIYYVPRGIVFYHNSNDILFECTNIEFMLSENIISFNYTNLDINKTYLIKRSSGDIQDAKILNNGGIFLKKDKFKIQANFDIKDDTKNIFTEHQKSIELDDFLELNNIKLEIDIPYFTESNINSKKDAQIKELLIYYNNKMKEYSVKINKYIVKK